MSIPTANYGFAKPDFNSRPWDGVVNSNYDLLDTILYTIAQIPNIVGIWKNSTAYTAGQNVLDPNSLVFYQCVTNNVSAATGLFAADRIANPANWSLTNPGQGTVRYDQGQALTAPQAQQAIANLQLFNYFIRYDAAQTLTYNQQLQVLNNLLIDGTEAGLTAAATTDVGNAGAQNVVINGTTTITSFGTRPNKYKLIRFTGVLVLTNSVSLVLPSLANITTQIGDTCIATSDASGAWYVRAYQRASGQSVVASARPGILAVTAATTLVAGDVDKTLRCTGTTAYTITLPALSTVGTSWGLRSIENNGTAIFTIAAGAGDNFEGVAAGSFGLLPKQRAYVYVDTDGWHVAWIERRPTIVAATLTSALASIDYLLPTGYAYYKLMIKMLNSNAGVVGLRLANDGVTFKSGASDYFNQVIYSAGTSLSQGAALAAQMNLAPGPDAISTDPPTFEGTLFQATASTRPRMQAYDVAAIESAGFIQRSPQLSNLQTTGYIFNAARIFVGAGTLGIGTTINIEGVPAQ